MERYRKAFRQKVIPAYYRGFWHVVIFAILQTLAIVVTGSMVDWSIFSPLYIFLSLMYATTFTYFLHRYMLHQPVPGFKWAHKMHHWHHTFYKSEFMEYDSLNDVYMLLMPPWLQIFYFVIYLPLLVVGLTIVFPVGIVMHFVFALTLWYGIYELVHWVEHLPPTHALMKWPLCNWLRRHHIVHHSKFKDQANFGIVEPSWDYIFKTKR